MTIRDYAERRQQLMQKIGPTGIVILPSAPIAQRNGDYDFPYRQQSDLYYLTGFVEPESAAILVPGREDGEFILFNRIKDRTHEIWEGVRAGQEGACKEFGADQAFAISDLENQLPALLEGREKIYYALGIDKMFDRIVLRALNKIRSKIRNGTQPPLAFIDISDTLHEMRLVKSDHEITLMKKAAQISAQAHKRAMEICKPGIFEYQLEAEIMYEFQRNGARFPAYSSIVGGGKNACILHYINNDEELKAGELVLIDAGAEYQYYAADITRTFPVSGVFSAEQRAIYDIVLEAQLAGIETLGPGALWNEAQDQIVKIITQGLMDLNILKGSLDELIEKQAYFPFYMHKSGHWLGLDVHDVGRYKVENQWRALETCMVLTVEPGIYISADQQNVDPRWHNIGVRIEDDILITAKGHEVISHFAPKTIDEIEALMA